MDEETASRVINEMKLKDFLLLFVLIAALAWGSILSGKLRFLPLRESPPQRDRIVWERSLANALKMAKTNHRFVFIDFYADWCGYCKQMDKTTYQNANLIQLSHRFVCARIDVDKNEELARAFKIDGLPTLVFVNPDASEVKRIEGYIPPPNLIAVMLSLTKTRR